MRSSKNMTSSTTKTSDRKDRLTDVKSNDDDDDDDMENNFDRVNAYYEEEYRCVNGNDTSSCDCCFVKTKDVQQQRRRYQQKSFLPLSMLQQQQTCTLLQVLHQKQNKKETKTTTTTALHAPKTKLHNTNSTTSIQSSTNYDPDSDSSEEVEWDGSMDYAISNKFTKNIDADSHDLSNFIVSSSDEEIEESEYDIDNDEDFDDGAAADDDIDVDCKNISQENDINIDDLSYETSSDSSDNEVNELIHLTKEVILISSDDDDTEVKKFPSIPKSRPKENSLNAVSGKCPTYQQQIPPQLSTRKSVPKSPAPAKLESKLSFRKRREELSQQLLLEFDQRAFGSILLLPSNYTGKPLVSLIWSNKLRTTAGLTRLSRVRSIPATCKQDDQMASRIAVIELSCKVIDDVSRLRSTLLHEMCHAAAWIIDDTAKPAHGSIFQKWAQRSSTAISDIVVTTTHNYEIDFKYKWVCMNYPHSCHVIVKRHSRSIDIDRHRCAICKSGLREVKKGETIIVPDTSKRISNSTLDKKKKASLQQQQQPAVLSAYNQFVRENAPLVRQQLMKSSVVAADNKVGQTNNINSDNALSKPLTGTSGGKVLQSDVMKECARLWKLQQQQMQYHGEAKK